MCSYMGMKTCLSLLRSPGAEPFEPPTCKAWRKGPTDHFEGGNTGRRETYPCHACLVSQRNAQPSVQPPAGGCWRAYIRQGGDCKVEMPSTGAKSVGGGCRMATRKLGKSGQEGQLSLSAFGGKFLRFVEAMSSSSFSVMDLCICFDAPFSSETFVSPRLADSAAPAAFCWTFDFAGMTRSIPALACALQTTGGLEGPPAIVWSDHAVVGRDAVMLVDTILVRRIAPCIVRKLRRIAQLIGGDACDIAIKARVVFQ
jgi:hypothetical protein